MRLAAFPALATPSVYLTLPTSLPSLALVERRAGPLGSTRRNSPEVTTYAAYLLRHHFDFVFACAKAIGDSGQRLDAFLGR